AMEHGTSYRLNIRIKVPVSSKIGKISHPALIPNATGARNFDEGSPGIIIPANEWTDLTFFGTAQRDSASSDKLLLELAPQESGLAVGNVFSLSRFVLSTGEQITGCVDNNRDWEPNLNFNHYYGVTTSINTGLPIGGRRFEGSVWVRAEAGKRVTLLLQATDWASDAVASSVITANGTWQEIKVPWNVPVRHTTDSIAMRLSYEQQGANGVALYWDDARLREIGDVEQISQATIKASVSVFVDVCGYNPWEYSFGDYDLSLRYCPGNEEESALPVLKASPVAIADRTKNIDFDKEYFFPIDTTKLGREKNNRSIKSDTIFIRIKQNGITTHSALTWYRAQFGRNAAELVVGGYSAVRDEGGIYVNAYDTSQEASKPESIGPTIYYFATNTKASPATVEILNKLVESALFSKDLGAPTGVDSEGQKLRRDAKRLRDFEQYAGVIQRASRIPTLDAGSFIKHQSISAWPSWKNELGTQLGLGQGIPTDPYPNASVFCKTETQCMSDCTRTGYEKNTCWNAGTKLFGITAVAPRTEVQTAVGINTINNQPNFTRGYSYHYIKLPGILGNHLSWFCGRLEYLKSATGSQEHCLTYQRAPNNTALRAAGAACTNPTECDSGRCVAQSRNSSARVCDSLLVPVSTNNPPSLTGVKVGVD
ncbi:MAG: hypothetical protein AAB855_00790, partial [Patescibacteria group bacterium]